MSKKINTPIFAVIVGVVLAIGSVAFVKPYNKNAKKPPQIVYYQFNLDQVSGDRTAGNYTQIMDPASPGCSGTGVVCVVSFNTANHPTLQDYLNTFSDDNSVVTAAFSQKH
jgi:hypothetical protein